MISADLKPQPRGRPSVLNEAVYNSLVETAATGNYVSTCCEAAGIHVSTYRNWMENAKDVQAYIDTNGIQDIFEIDDLPDDVKGKLIYYRLFSDIKTAQANAIKKLHDKVYEASQAGPQYWIAAMTMMERIRPELYGKRDSVSVELQEGTALLEKLSKVLRNTAIGPGNQG